MDFFVGFLIISNYIVVVKFIQFWNKTEISTMVVFYRIKIFLNICTEPQTLNRTSPWLANDFNFPTYSHSFLAAFVNRTTNNYNVQVGILLLSQMLYSNMKLLLLENTWNAKIVAFNTMLSNIDVLETCCFRDLIAYILSNLCLGGL